VCRLARGNAWGHQRIRGELLELGITRSKGCIADILHRNGLPPSPQRQGLTWQQFLSRHAEVLLCADLFTKEVWAFCGLRTAYVLFVMHLLTRRVVLAEATFCPHGQLMSCEPRFVMHDRDKLLAWDFDAALTGAEAKVMGTSFRAPDVNAHVERWVGSVTAERLDHLILFGMSSLQRALRIYRDFFNARRPHQGISSRMPDQQANGDAVHTGGRPERAFAVEREHFLGGLLNSYYREAA
jgi:putative transposase